jgi:Uma2 family endonuclease
MSAAQSNHQRHHTVEEYFALEEKSGIRHEYFHGEIFPLDGPTAMAGGTRAHNRLIQNCTFGLRTGLRGQGCEIYAENVRLAIAEGEHYSYPDVLVSCDPHDYDPRTVHSATLIIEVLSKSTEARDRGWKFEQYQLMPSLQQYVLVSQYRVLVNSFVRTDHGTWELTSLRKLTDTLHLPALQSQLPLAEIYEGINIPPLRLAD